MVDECGPEWLVNQIAHVLRNPLFAAAVQLDAIAIRATDDPALAKPTAVLREQLARLEAIIDDMLLYGREPRPASRPVDPRSLVDAVADAYAEPDREQRAAVTVIGSSPDLETRWDPELVRRILHRVLDNAIQHTDPPHEVTITIRPSTDAVALEVADHGRGMTPELLELATRPFFPQHRGRPGLGLAIARKLTAALGGDLSIRSIPDAGTTVTVTLPLVVDVPP
jgi:signal transduction histidine kinase